MDLRSLDDTRTLARRLLERIPPGSLLLLTGPLGAGKTTFVQALAAELDSPARVSSPTYTLIHEYPSPRGLLVHIDAYRLPDADALLTMGLDDYLDRARLVVIEWGGPLKSHYPEAFVLHLNFDGERRRARVETPPEGAWG